MLATTASFLKHLSSGPRASSTVCTSYPACLPEISLFPVLMVKSKSRASLARTSSKSLLETPSHWPGFRYRIRSCHLSLSHNGLHALLGNFACPLRTVLEQLEELTGPGLSSIPFQSSRELVREEPHPRPYAQCKDLRFDQGPADLKAGRFLCL